MSAWFKNLFTSSRPKTGLTPAAATPSQTAEDCKNRGNAHFARDELEEALAYYRQAIAVAPGYAEAHNNMGLALSRLGRESEALSCFIKAAALKPDLVQAHINCGNAFLHADRYDEAQASFNQALALDPGMPDIQNNLGHLLYRQGRFDEAETRFRRALSLQPDLAEAHHNLGRIFHQQGRLAEATASYRQAFALRPDNAAVHDDLGRLLEAQCRLDEAISWRKTLLSLNPDSPVAHTNLGNLLQRHGRLDEAIACYRTALSCEPNLPDALSNLGVALQKRGKLSDAIDCFRKALGLDPDFADALSNLGNALRGQGRFVEAQACLNRALSLNPALAEAHNGLGLMLRMGGRSDDAIASFRRALSLSPACAEIHNNLGYALQDQGRIDEAIKCYREALALKPDYAEAHSNLLFCLNYHPDLSGEAIFAEYRRWNELHARPLRLREMPHANRHDPLRRLRIGYVSPDLRRHAARHFIEPLLAHHDKTQVEVFAYAQVAVEDDVSARLKGYVDQWRNTVGLNDEEMAQLIRQDGIDILVDLAGHTANHRLLVFARKPAPIQMSWMGYGYTTGLDAIDYFIADPAFAPPGCEPLFAEKLLRLPVYAAYRPAEGMGEPGPLPALQNGFVTFGTLTRSIRVNHRVVTAWAEILRRLPTARLLINSTNFHSPAMQAEMTRRFADYGIPAEQLILGFDSPPWDVMRRIDISLDCFPHNSGTTLFESLYMGLPYITLKGRPSVGCLGAAILAGVGHPEWIASSADDYVDRAVALASDLDRLASLRACLRQRMQGSLLMNEPAFANSLEAAYRNIWQLWCGQLSRDSSHE